MLLYKSSYFSSTQRILKFIPSMINSSMSSATPTSNVRSTAASGSMVYESERAVHEYLLLHFGESKDLMPYPFGPQEALHFPQRCAQLCMNQYIANNGNENKTVRALDVGCAVGGATFEMSKMFHKVVGIDFSHHFINAANTIKELDNNEKIPFQIMRTGELMQQCHTLPFDPSIHKHNCEFYQGDACNLDPKLGTFDVILASNLLCRLPYPRKFIMDVDKFLNKNGILVLISPYSWLEEYTSKSQWFGGIEDEKRESFDVLHEFIKENHHNLHLVHRENMSFLIREHSRKFQYGVSDAIVYKKN